MSVIHQGQPPTYQEAQLLAQVQLSASAGSPAEQEKNSAPALITVTQGSEADPVVEEQKKIIYRHPLFPLMALLFKKCEQACSSSDVFACSDYDTDIQHFVQQQQQQNKPFYTDDQELDNLMLRAVQVLRIHLLELEKVSDLCKDFCSRYITCLKGKLQSENLLRLDDLDSPPLSPTPGSTNPAGLGAAAPMVSLPSNPVVSQLGGGVMMQPGLSMATISQGQIISGNMVYQMVHTPQGIVAQPIQIQPSPLQGAVTPTPVIHGNAPLSQIGMMGSPTSAQPAGGQAGSSLSMSADDSFDDDDPLGKKKNAKRGVLPKHATQIMKTWLFQHLVHPYPTEDEKRQIASQTNLTLLQVNNWFINARRRILQPMLDSGAGDSKVKKSKPTTRPQQRFWPEAIANITPQLPPHLQQKQQSASQPSSPSSSSAAETTGPIVVTANGQMVTAGNPIPISLTSLTALNTNLLLAQQASSAAVTLVTPPSVMAASTSDDLQPQNLVLSLNCDTEASSGD